jgi:hypothetical protein
MNYLVVKAYAEGRLAGARYFRAKQEDGGEPHPTNPYQVSPYLEGVDWDRGFGDGYQLQERALATSDV